MRVRSIASTVLAAAVLVVSGGALRAQQAVDAPSTLAPVEGQRWRRVAVENLLFLAELDRRQRAGASGAEARLITERRALSLGVLGQAYRALLATRARRAPGPAPSAGDGAGGEAALARYLERAVHRSWPLAKLAAGGPELSADDPAVLFYKHFVDELLRLARLFETTPSEVFAYSDQEVLGFELPSGTLCLTFDDGPGAGTRDVLAALAGAHVPATFFVLGSRLTRPKTATESRALLFETATAGHEIGVHSATHANLARLSESRQEGELAGPLTLIGDLLGRKPAAFRAPFGSRTAAGHLRILAHYARHVLWNIDTQDWQRKFTPSIILHRVERLAHLYDGGIVLMHDSHRSSARALPRIIADLTSAGFRFATVSDALGLTGPGSRKGQVPAKP